MLTIYTNHPGGRATHSKVLSKSAEQILKSRKIALPQITTRVFWRFSNEMGRTIRLSNRIFRFFQVNGKYPFVPAFLSSLGWHLSKTDSLCRSQNCPSKGVYYRRILFVVTFYIALPSIAKIQYRFHPLVVQEFAGTPFRQGPVVQTFDSAIHKVKSIQWITELVSLILIRWIGIHPVDSAIQRSNV